MPVADFRDLCYEYALKQVDKQRVNFKRLGVLGDWNNPYITLTKDFEARQLEIFAEMADKGLIYKGLKPVYWSWSSESALAEAEVEYHDVTSDSIYLAFKVVDGKGVLDNDTEIVIWTTTPWTIPGNLAVCINDLFEYAVFKCRGRKLLVAKDLVEGFVKELGETEYEIIKTVKGSSLEYVTYVNPLGKVCPVICGSHVTLDAGTGCVHTAPGFGEDDFIVGKKYGLDIFAPVDGKGFLTEEAQEFGGLFYTHNKIISSSFSISDDTANFMKCKDYLDAKLGEHHTSDATPFAAVNGGSVHYFIYYKDGYKYNLSHGSALQYFTLEISQGEPHGAPSRKHNFFVNMNKELTNEKYEKYLPYIYVMYSAAKNKILESCNETIYKGTKLKKSEIAELENLAKDKKKIIWTKPFLTCTKNEKFAIECLKDYDEREGGDEDDREEEIADADAVKVKFVINPAKGGILVSNMNTGRFRRLGDDEEIVIFPFTPFKISDVKKEKALIDNGVTIKKNRFVKL